MPLDGPNIFLAQIEPLEPFDGEPSQPVAPPPPRPARPMTFSDLQGAMHDYGTGKNVDHTFRNGSLVILAIIAVVVLMSHLREKHKNAAPPDSVRKLGRELGRPVRFPLCTGVLLRWVAITCKVPFASLLLSSHLFDRCVQQWSHEHTFSIVRSWGKSRLERLRPVLFEA